MTINCYGIPTQVNGVKFAKLLGLVGDMRSQEGVYGTDFIVSTASGLTAHVGTSAGSLVGGILVENDAQATVTFQSNGASNDRIDIVAIQTDTSGTQTTAGTLVVVKGSPAATPVPPGLTQSLGGIWQTALARVTVRHGASSVTSGDIVDARPTPRRPRTFQFAGFSQSNVGSGAGQVTVLSNTLDDPGWTYKVKVEGNVKVQATSDGLGHVNARVFVDGALTSSTQTDQGCTSVAPFDGAVSAAITGVATFYVTVAGSSINDPHFNVDASSSNLVLTVQPA